MQSGPLRTALFMNPTIQYHTCPGSAGEKQAPAVALKRSKFFVLVLLFIFLSGRSWGQSSSDYAVHANIIYRFTKYIDWPAEKKKGDFVIAVVGDSPLYEEMKKSIEGKMVGEQKITVKEFSVSANLTACNILFVSEEESSDIKKIAARTAWAPVLILYESEGSARSGSCINFSLAG